jgi:hypothetical protein
MPSRDINGDPISGAERRSRRTDPKNDAPFKIGPPPVNEGAKAVEAWGASLAALVLLAAEKGPSPRIRWVHNALRKLGHLKEKARHAYKAALALDIDLVGDVPPTASICLAAWAYYRLARAIHEGATSAKWDVEAFDRLSLVIDAAASVGVAAPSPAFDGLGQRWYYIGRTI